MKPTRQENLAERLTEIDDDMLRTAYEIDDAEKLSAYTKSSYASTRNKPRFHKMALLVASLLLMITAAALIYQQNLPISWVEGSFAIDVTNPQEVVGMADYVFVGYVNSNDGTEYLLPESEMGLPYTNYTVTVIENIKGELTTTEPIQLKKDGGIAQNKKCICLFEGDYLPEEGKLYLFSVNAGRSGELICAAPNSSIPLNEDAETINASAFSIQSAKQTITNSEVIQVYKNAVKNEIKFNRDRYLSVYDASGREIVIGTPIETAVPAGQEDAPDN